MSNPILQKTLTAIALAACAVPALAQGTVGNWPDKPVKWVVPFPPGGAMDAIARTLGEVAGRKLGQPFVIENKPGAGGNIGSDFVAKQPADGYTLMITSIGMATNGALYNKLSYDPIKDFAPVSLLAVVPNVLVAGAKQSDVKNVKDLIAKAKQRPDALTYASAGNGTSIHLAGANFTSLTGVKMLHVPYRGSGPAVTDLLGGQVDFMFDSITSARPHIEAGKLRAIAITTKTRSPSLPDVPTVAEAGVPGYEVSPWFATFMPAGTPAPIVAKLGQTLNEAMNDPEVKKRLDAIGAEPIGSTPQALAAHLKTETDRWTKLIKASNIKVD
ncbi:Bug family tripartite tricarboxylate transporter substrate binding protein [Comamonas endophytica]|uniref:Tripartite tricarboxylate transporter substrate binding protein n=1 Tax=Comamonas endophytica TaxID=2949090 RepID=A0ABY6G8S2_9BURK|nr:MULTISPECIES: tripartite tricarboxylate transporter substrate binding protein [unclassified Acidovorax]MCD2511405.1 tripartite tricarboxylate transporter substrate binding protein [Acidovorax sp. D4N7]UYG50797.1 tripartite tricarboxylate transporter substrate binding protein [Acidovorax sp. 5MLIR]